MKSILRRHAGAVLLAVLLVTAALSISAARAEAADDGTCKITVKYDSSLASLNMYDNSTKDAVANKSSLKIEENGFTHQLVIEFTIKEGYRIKSVTWNGDDNTDGFIEGAYGGMGKALKEDTVCELKLEKIPATLPVVTGADIYSDRVYSDHLKDLVKDTFTIDEDTFKLWAKPAFSDGKTYADYVALGTWQFSADGSTWEDCSKYGWSARTDFWPGWKYWPDSLPIDFINDSNYYIRIRLDGRPFYSRGTAYSDAIFVNGDGKVTPKKVKTPAPSVEDEPTEYAADKVTLSKTSGTYDGSVQKPAVKVTGKNGEVLKEGTDYTVIYPAGMKNAGDYRITVKGTGNYSFTKTLSYKITKKAAAVKISVKTKKIKYSKLKKAKQTFKLKASATSKASITYKKVSGNKKITVAAKSGKVTVKKGLKKGTYKVKIKAKAAANKNYKAASKTKTIKIIVK